MNQPVPVPVEKERAPKSPKRDSETLLKEAFRRWLKDKGINMLAANFSIDAIKQLEGPNPYAHAMTIRFDGAKED